MENNIYPNAATELVEIFKFIEEPVLEKIPEKIKEELKKMSNKEYKFELDKTKKLSEQKLLPETKNLLAGIFIKYCCREEDGNEILVVCKENDIRVEKEKKEKYDTTEIFKSEKNQEKEIEKNNEENIEKNEEPGKFKLVVIENVPWYKKVTRKLRSFFWNLKNE